MDSKNKKTINTIGKIGRVVSTIMLVLTILAAAAVLACTAGAAFLPKETIDITLDGDINITSAGTLFAKLDKLLDIKQEGDGAQVNLAGTGDVTVSIAGDDDILEDSNLTKIDNGYKIDIKPEYPDPEPESDVDAEGYEILEDVSELNELDSADA